MSRAWYEHNGLTYSDLDPRFDDDDAYRRWADSLLEGPIFITDAHVDLEDAVSVLGLQLRLRGLAESCDRRFFAEYPEFTRRQRFAYPGESWELACFADDQPRGGAMPTVRVHRPSPRTRMCEFLHPEKFPILKAKLRRASSFAGHGAVFETFDFTDLTRVPVLFNELRALTERDDCLWFHVKSNEAVRERFVCPGELQLKRAAGIWEFVEVRRNDGHLDRVLLDSGEPCRRSPRPHGSEQLVPDRYAPSRIYPCHGLRGLAEAPTRN